MKLKIVIALLLLASLSCQPPKQETVEKVDMVPYNLQAVMKDGGFELAWQCKLEGTISGYNIYASERSLNKQYPDGNFPAEIKPINHPVFPGDTDLSDGIEHYDASGLENGKRYYVTVRTVYPDRTESKPAAEVVVVPGPSGKFEIVERFKGGDDGWSFAGSRPVNADDAANDIFFQVQNGVNYLASPTRLDGFLNRTLLARLSYKGDYATVQGKVNEANIDPTKDRVEVSAGDWVLAKLASGQSVLLSVDAVEKADPHKVTLSYYVCTLTDKIFF